MEITQDSSCEEVAEYLKEELGIPQRFCQLFIDNYVDGMEFLSLTRDDLFKICEAAGIVKKVLRHLDQLRSPQASKNVASDLALSTSSPAESAMLATSIPSNVSCDVWPCDVTDAASSPAQSSESQSIATPCTPTSSKSATRVSTPVSSKSTGASTPVSSQPTRIELPSVWSCDTQKCLNEGRVTPSVRKEIVYTMSVMLSAICESPTPSQCERVANDIIIKYPFLADPFGKSPSGSWKLKIMECIRNRDKYKKKSNTPKSRESKGKSKLRAGTSFIVSKNHQLPTQSFEDLQAAIIAEMANEKPREEVLKPLMAATFNNRHSTISETPISETVKIYPSLKLPNIIEHEFSLLIKDASIKDKFLKEWLKWQEAILNYAGDLKKKAIVTLMDQCQDRDKDDYNYKQIFTLKILVSLFLSKGTTFDDAFVLLFSEYEVATPLEEIATLMKENVPRIVHLKTSNQYFVVAEQDILTEVVSISDAIFVWFAVHYIFNIKYTRKIVSIGFFFQDNIFALVDGTSRPSTYNAVVGDIRQCLTSLAMNIMKKLQEYKEDKVEQSCAIVDSTLIKVCI
uniref:SAM domain-containing protein n=1 Tax=Amphimedon queenslandica TaxID=400682 RepID=A0A1X7TLA5_AMPQE